MKFPAWAFALVMLGGRASWAADDLPKRAAGETMDFEPKLMLDGPHAATAQPSATPAADERVKALESALALAGKRAAQGEQLFKGGILAKVEAEDRELRVVQLRGQLAAARVALAESGAEAARKAFEAHQAPQASVDAADAVLKQMRADAASASAAWAKAQIDAAELDLKRKRKLYLEGVITRYEVQRAEERLAALSGTTAPR